MGAALGLEEKHKQEAEKQKKYEEEQMNEMMKHQQMPLGKKGLKLIHFNS